ncbi:hypothetical protein H310_07138 [Aphanomyces invadans]|uniref:Homologous recombination OB-fold protein OB-fold domain-containing protein n=1 Tax=Aphanomyces invadans TaxID=157072 RepID=A0A024U4L6_9STRA|nr:hypothetical protein H310_07138 [Aphanomyces invadans]ETW00553.1 hypothetical protein H310_07138 [Aphanomyces invadans]|eukprot:XP_008870688.1 hypothetical protein H310_07138 [Aphanomyces invadans]
MPWHEGGGDGPTPPKGAPMRRINGPLGDLWKKMTKSIQQHSERTHHDALGLEAHSDFEHGPWIEMCNFVGIAATEGEIHGGVDLSRLPMNTEQVALGFQSTGVIEQDLMLLIRSSKYVDEEIVATFHDPLGCIDGYFHRDVVDAVGAALVKNTGVILRSVTVFMPIERRQQYLNICRSNIVRIFPSSSQHADEVAAFNNNLAATSVHNPPGSSRFVLEDPSGEATTAADLVAMTQRHVIHQSYAQRAPPSGGRRGKQKWAWRSFVPKKKKQKQISQDDASPQQPSLSSSESSASPKRTPRPPRPTPSAIPQAPRAIVAPPTARPPGAHAPVPDTRPAVSIQEALVPRPPSPVHVAKPHPVVSAVRPPPPLPSPKDSHVGAQDVISQAVDAVLNDDDW